MKHRNESRVQNEQSTILIKKILANEEREKLERI